MPDDISAAHGLEDGLEGLGALLVVRLAGHHLDLLAVSLEGVEEELLAGSALQNHTAGDRADLVLEVLAVLAVGELLDDSGIEYWTSNLWG